MAANPDFAPSWETIEGAFKAMKRGLKMSPWQFGQLFKQIGEWIRAGENETGLTRRVGPVLVYDDWSWPWFDACAKRLDAAAVWPRQWERDGILPGTRWADMPKGLAGNYLVHTLAGAIYTEGHAAQTNDAAVLAHFVATLRPSYEDCQAERFMCDLHSPALHAGDFSKLPPYFPMCGIRLSMISRRKFGQ